jgi:hypothetical protein
MGKYEPGKLYELTKPEREETFPHRRKTWKIKFEGTFSRLGVNEAEARREAEEFLKHLVVLENSKITNISEKGYYGK